MSAEVALLGLLGLLLLALRPSLVVLLGCLWGVGRVDGGHMVAVSGRRGSAELMSAASAWCVSAELVLLPSTAGSAPSGAAWLVDGMVARSPEGPCGCLPVSTTATGVAKEARDGALILPIKKEPKSQSLRRSWCN